MYICVPRSLNNNIQANVTFTSTHHFIKPTYNSIDFSANCTKHCKNTTNIASNIMTKLMVSCNRGSVGYSAIRFGVGPGMEFGIR